MADGICRREFSAVELLLAHASQIEKVNPAVTAIVTLDLDQALVLAQRADHELARTGEPIGPLHGLPVAVKDLEDTGGMRTTYGSPIFRDHVPQHDGMLAERLRGAGAVIIGKTNTPEFGAGSQTFNEVFGITRNPYDLHRTPGGSSGGAAVAVACGMVPFADGSDLAASIRNPASFCNVVGLRPSPGRWPATKDGDDGWDPLSVLGPIARTVGDVGLVLEALSGPDARSPISIAGSPETGAIVAPPDLRGTRVAWSRNLGDLPVEAEVTTTLEAQRQTLVHLGCIVEDAEPDLSEADEAFDVLRALGFLRGLGPIVATHPGMVKDTVEWNVRRGIELTSAAIANALATRTRVYQTMREFLERYDVLALPASQVVPFPVEVQWIKQIGACELQHYVEWLRICSRVTVSAHPAVCVPAGFTAAGLPVGLQLVGRYRDEAGLLGIAAAFEAATGFGLWRPPHSQ